ncbi:MAG: hypothetical protein K8F30_03690 [Taibaiella sp.]|nr:hypothetical protein [Taibaiella sp.]
MNKNLRYVTATFIASIILMWYALFNGYPLVTGDSGAYIRFAYDFAVLKDRSSFYSIWLALTGLRGLAFAGVNGTAWLPVFFQCLLVAILLLRYARIAGMAATGLWAYLITITLTAFLTGASWTAAYIMPDIFTPVLLLAVVLYLFDDSASRWMNAGYLALFGFAVLVHNSHFLVALLLCLLLLLYAQVVKYQALKPKLFKLLGVTVLCLLLVCTINFMYGMGFTLSAGSHVYMAGKLVETGTMRQYLDEQCAEKDYKLCTYKNDLPERAYEYIWNDNSPFLQNRRVGEQRL